MYRLLFMVFGENSYWVIGAAVILAVGFTIIGWRLYRGPETQANVWISDMSVNQGEPLILTIENSGTRSTEFGHPYEIWEESSNGELSLVELEIAWIAEQIELYKGETWTQEIYTDILPGKYILRKVITVKGIGESRHSFDLTVRRVDP